MHTKTLKNKLGFTLAEVLITLGIIGVVAALTIPALIADYNTKQWNTAATIFEKKLEDALKVMNSQSTLSGLGTTESFVQELTKHFKASKVCTNDELLECFSPNVYWDNGKESLDNIDISIISTSRNFGQKDWKTNIVGVQFANGTSALIAYNPTESCVQDTHSNQISGNDCLAILYDTTSAKQPNTFGKDLRSNSNVTRLGTGCIFEVGSTCYASAPFIPEPITKAECEELKDNLKIKYCSGNSDYWAGAVKACDGIDKMPTQAQLSELVKYMQRDNAFTANANALGFTVNSNSALSIWSKSEYNGANAYSWHGSPTSSNSHNGPRGDNRRQVVCLGD